MDGGIRAKLKGRTTTFNHGKRSGNMAEYKQHSYSLKQNAGTGTKWSRYSTAQT
jgi:hypothetical protein